MTFQIMVPTTITDANFDASNVPEADYTAWSSVTAYVVGDRVIITGTTHKIYECLIAHTNQTPLTASNLFPAAGAEWITVSATNRWKPFDKILSSPCVRTGDIAYRLLMTAPVVDTVAFFGVTGGSVQVIVYDTDVTRRNLSIFSEEFDNAAYAYTRSAVSANGAQDPLGSYQADSFFEDSTAAATHFCDLPSISYTNAVVYTDSIYVKRRAGLGNRDLRLTPAVAAFPAGPVATFDLGAGTFTTAGGATGAMTGPDAYGYYRCSITATAGATAAAQTRASLMSAGTVTYNGNGVAGVEAFGRMVNVGALGAYQWIRGAGTFGDITFNSIQNKSVLLGGNSAEAVFRNIGADVGDYVAFAIYAGVGNTSQVGEISLGTSYPVGDLTGLSPGIIDYSSKVLDTFGNAAIVPRSFAKLADYTISMNKTDTAQLVNFLAALRSVPVVWYDTDDLTGDWGSMVYGFYKEFSIPLTSASKAFAALRVEGIV